MNLKFISCVLLGFLLLTTSSGPSIGTENIGRYSLGGQKFFLLDVPPAWIQQVRKSSPQFPPTISFHPSSGSGFKVLITPFWPPKAAARTTPEELKSYLSAAAIQALSQSIEKNVNLHSLNGSGVFGSYFSVTDRAPKPGEYKYMTQGLLSLGELHVTFTVLTNEEGQYVVPQVLEMLRGAKYGEG